MTRLISYAGAWGAGLCLCASLVFAQDSGTTFLTPPQTQSDYPTVASPPAVDTSISYVDETSEDFLTTDRTPAPQVQRTRRTGTQGPNVFVIVGLFAVALFLLLKFGGAGALLRADPKSGSKPKKRAKGWGLTASEAPAGDILSQIRAMTDRRAALILLLRYCLLQAADETDTMFKRADTEREALSRLPDTWRHRDKLRHILMQTELVHYGGRAIDDDDYETALSHGSTILRAA